MNNYEKAKLLVQERVELKDGILELERVQHRIIFSSLVILSSAIGIIFNVNVFGNGSIIKTILLILSQVEFLLIIFNFQIMRNMAVKAEYIMAIEDKINFLAGEKICIWESEISPNYLYHPKSIAFWIACVLSLCFLGAFVLMYFLIKIYFNKTLIDIVYISEFSICLLIFLFMQIEGGRIRRYARNQFNLG